MGITKKLFSFPFYSLNKAIDDFIADIEQFNCSNGITTDGTVKNKEVLHSVSISDCKDEPEMEIKSECTKYTEAQYKTTTRPVINGVRIKKSSNRTDSIDGSPFEEVPNSSNSKNWSNHRETSTHKLCADIPRINKSQKIKVIASAVGAKNYKSKTLKLSGNIECEFGVI